MLKYYLNAKQTIADLKKNHEIELTRVTDDLEASLKELNQTKDELYKI